MTDRFKNTYRIPPARWRDRNYGANAAYFVTVYTAHRERFFRELSDGEMRLSETGKTVQAEWVKTTALRPDMNIMPGEYAVMSNHFHGIIVIGENRYNTGDGDGDGGAVETRCIASLRQNAVQQQWQSILNDATKAVNNSIFNIKNRNVMNRNDFSERMDATDCDSRTNNRHGSGFAWMPSLTQTHAHAPRRRRDAMHRVSTIQRIALPMPTATNQMM